MASTAVEHQAAQAALVSLLLADLERAWATLDIDNLDATLPTFIETIAALISYYGAASASIAADFYEDSRAEAGITTPFRVVPADPPDFEQIDTEIRWATRGLWTRQSPDLDAARALVAGVVEKDVLDTGRDTTFDAVELDTDARGWYRQTEADPCYFCAVLAIRGAVYRSRASASFRPHDNCRCTAEPIFGKHEMSDRVREWKKLYQQATRGKGKKLLLWRRAFEGR